MNDIEKEQKKIYDDQTKAFMKDRKANADEKIAPLKEEVTHKVGDTVYATHPVKRYTTMTGKVTHVGRTLTTLTHKDGTTGTYPHHDVNKDYEVLHPNPYTKEREKRANESVSEEFKDQAGATKKSAESRAKVKHDLEKTFGKKKMFKTTGDKANFKHEVETLRSNVGNEKWRNESMDESFEPGKTVYTSHTDKILKGKIIGKDTDNKDQYIVQHKDGRHSVHQDNIHPQRKLAGYMHEDVSESEFKGTPTVKTDKYSWGTMKTIHHGNSFSIPLHPEHHQAISKLKDGESHSFKDETKAKWTATRKGPTVHFAGSVGHTAVPHESLHEDTKHMKFSEFVAEGVFDWKTNKSEVDWSDKKDKKTETSAAGGTIHKARETERNAETGGKAAKKSVGRPAGAYQGSYKIDKAKRADPKNKEELSKKVMAAKAEGFAIRADYKTAMNAAIKKRQEELWNEKK